MALTHVGFLMLYVPLSRGLVLAALWDWFVSALGHAIGTLIREANRWRYTEDYWIIHKERWQEKLSSMNSNCTDYSNTSSHYDGER